ncbi:alpha-amylase [Methylocystis sp. Sn-Cys]|uniref:alpha-amylase n=1 Tax=Methylocystis sp. Sn-Cys TaxID=1701263 RepID=UPI001923A435|nr:alpha-amylase [Methylocystis sp. Sn-Cys]MBL1257667.1 alpha-amylase [Methylocystis sp. Sn-Cys]
MSKRTMSRIGNALFMLCLAASGAWADGAPKSEVTPPPQPLPPQPLAPAPLGVFGADMPPAGKLILSIVPQFLGRSTSLEGARPVSSQEIVATTPWFFDPRQKLRGVPQSALQAVQTVQLAYGVTKVLSIVVGTGMTEKNLSFLTFKGLSGITPLGMSYTGTDSISDTTASAIWRVYEDHINRVQVNVGMSFPTGSNHNTFTLLQPNGTYATTRAFYAMQIGTGTFDAMPGVVYAGQLNNWSWGLSYRGRFPLAANPEGYRWGDLHEFTGWGGYSWIPGVTTTFRVTGSLEGPIRGFDWNIAGKAQAANPNFYGGQRVELFGGATISGKLVGYENVLLAIEAGLPVYQNLNGPQLSKAWQAGLALRFKI